VRRLLPHAVLVCTALGCDDPRDARDAATSTADASALDAGALDAGALDVGALDVGALDVGPVSSDVSLFDAGLLDASPFDASPFDAAPFDDAFVTSDAFVVPDAFLAADAFLTADAFLARDAFAAPDARAGGGCVSGASGSHVVRFRWRGSGAGSTAYVDYEANTLPDTSRWRVTANSRSIGYRPVFDDVFLGEGGLDLEGTAFIDVELSLSGLSSLRGVTLAIYGRSFNTTSSGSFEWQTFDGTGAAPWGLVANSAPYEWYGADATTEFTAGDAGVLLRIYPGGPSGALIVNRVEVCFDAS
jgi:hypothetical protein